MRSNLAFSAGLLSALAAIGCHHHVPRQVRDSFARCAPGFAIDECAKGLNAAGVICEEDAASQTNPKALLAYRCTMEEGRWNHVSVLASPGDRTRIAHLSLEAMNGGKDVLDEAAKAMARGCGGPGKPFNLSSASGFTWSAPGSAGPADGEATVSLTEDGLTLEESFTAPATPGRYESWLQECERATAEQGLM